jgi:hypothetical protein
MYLFRLLKDLDPKARKIIQQGRPQSSYFKAENESTGGKAKLLFKSQPVAEQDSSLENETAATSDSSDTSPVREPLKRHDSVSSVSQTRANFNKKALANRRRVSISFGEGMSIVCRAPSPALMPVLKFLL